MATQTKAKKKKTEAPPKTLNVAFVWDMSGSMGSIKGATKEGTQGYLMDLQKEERKLIKKHGEGVYTRLSLTIFDTVFEQWIVDEPILNIDAEMTVNKYGPRGGTALYDAIANTIADVESRLADRKNEKCLVIVMTDGHENSSKEYGLHQDGKNKLFKLIKSYEKKGNWTFVYLGANVDAYSEAVAIGIPQGNAAFYSASAGSVGATMDSATPMTTNLRHRVGGQSSSAFADANLAQDFRDDEDKDEGNSTLWTPGKKKR